MGRFRPNPRFAEQQRRDPRFRRGLAEAVEPARRNADAMARAAHAPWMPKPGSGTTDVVETVTTATGVRLTIRHYDGHLVEFGSKNNPPYAPLRRGVRAAGLRLDETPK